ncbi:MAG: hypothetical protein ABJC60_03390 [Actinomycetota bacterium]
MGSSAQIRPSAAKATDCDAVVRWGTQPAGSGSPDARSVPPGVGVALDEAGTDEDAEGAGVSGEVQAAKTSTSATSPREM